MKIFYIKRGITETEIFILGIKFFIRYSYREIVLKNYLRKKNELQKKFGKYKIKVGFLVNESAKWQYQSLYEEMEKSSYFEPIVLVTQMVVAHQSQKHFFKSIKDCYNFFQSKNLNIRYAYDLDKKSFITPKDFGIDILFYQQPWQLDDSQCPIIASKSTLTCYVPYGLYLMENSAIYINNFHDLLWQIFVEDRGQIGRIKSLTGKNDINAYYAGYPKLDAYCKIKVHKNKKKTIIYAPHHSFEQDGLRCATFHENGLKILALAKKYRKQVNWVFKPHPRFKTAVVDNNIMSETEINNYYNQWEELGEIYEDGNYMQLFVDSDAMITDCISFLGEYLPSKNPIFHLISPFARFNDFAKSFIGSFYQIHNISELEENFKKVIIKNEDVKKDERLEKIKILFNPKETSASKIINFLSKSLGYNK